MKLISFSFITLFSLSPLLGQDSIRWKKTSLFMGPYLTKTSSQLIEVDQKNINRQCSNFVERVFDKQGEIKHKRLVKEFDSERKQPVTYLNRKNFFKSYALKEKINFDTLIRDVSATIGSDNQAKYLPFYVQKKVTNRIQLDGAMKVEVVINDAFKSLTLAAETLGLEQSEVATYPEGNEFLIVLHGRDLACDLLNKKIHILVTVPNFIELEEKSSEQLEAAYNKEILPLVVKTKRESYSDRIRAALLGYRLGHLIENEYRIDSFSQQEEAITGFMDLLFYNNTLKLKKKFINENGKARLKVPVFNPAGNVKVQLYL